MLLLFRISYLRCINIYHARDGLSTHGTKSDFSAALFATRSMRALQEQCGARVIHAHRTRGLRGLWGLETIARAHVRARRLLCWSMWQEQVLRTELHCWELRHLLWRVCVVHLILFGWALIVEQCLIDLLIISDTARCECAVTDDTCQRWICNHIIALCWGVIALRVHVLCHVVGHFVRHWFWAIGLAHVLHDMNQVLLAAHGRHSHIVLHHCAVVVRCTEWEIMLWSVALDFGIARAEWGHVTFRRRIRTLHWILARGPTRTLTAR